MRLRFGAALAALLMTMPLAHAQAIPKEADMSLWCGYAMVYGAQVMREDNKNAGIVDDWDRQSALLIRLGREMLVAMGLSPTRVDQVDAEIKARTDAQMIAGDPLKASYNYQSCKVLADLKERNGIETPRG
jgi:hypothetical protein